MEMEGGEEQPGRDGVHHLVWPGQAWLPPRPRNLLQGAGVLPPHHPRRRLRWPPLSLQLL